MRRRLVAGLSAPLVAAAGPATAAWVVPSGGGAGTATARSLAAPTGVTARAVSSTAIEVAFTAAPAQPPGAVTRVVRDRTVSGSLVVCTQPTSPCTDTGLTPGVQYAYTAETVVGTWAAAAAAVRASTPGTLAVTSTSLPPATTGSSYSQVLTAGGGAAPYRWSVTSGALPAGLTLSSAGTVSGTPSAAGTSTATVQVEDALGQSATAPLSITTSAAVTATQLVLTAASPWTAGTSQQVTLAARTSTGAVDPSFAGTRTVSWGGAALTAGPNGAAPTAPTTVTFEHGTAGATVTLVRAPGGVLTATIPGLPAASAGVTVVAAPASSLAFGQQPTAGQSKSTVKPSPTVLVQDAYGNAVSSTATVQLSVATGPAGTSVSGGTATASAGTATFADLRLSAAGTFTLTASSAGLAPVTSASFTLS